MDKMPELIPEIPAVTSVPPSSLFECQICYLESPMEECVGCDNAHVFCASCVINHAKQVAYGQGRPSVDCLEVDCDAGFPRSKPNFFDRGQCLK